MSHTRWQQEEGIITGHIKGGGEQGDADARDACKSQQNKGMHKSELVRRCSLSILARHREILTLSIASGCSLVLHSVLAEAGRLATVSSSAEKDTSHDL